MIVGHAQAAVPDSPHQHCTALLPRWEPPVHRVPLHKPRMGDTAKRAKGPSRRQSARIITQLSITCRWQRQPHGLGGILQQLNFDCCATMHCSLTVDHNRLDCFVAFANVLVSTWFASQVQCLERPVSFPPCALAKVVTRTDAYDIFFPALKLPNIPVDTRG